MTRDVYKVQGHTEQCKLSLEGRGRCPRGGHVETDDCPQGTQTHCSLGNMSDERHGTDGPFQHPHPLSPTAELLLTRVSG